MPEEVTIPPCPFCGCKDIIELEGFNPVWMKCGKCGSYAKKDIWNRRTPDPGTSVIRWVRYDGTPETLPEPERGVVLRMASSIRTDDEFEECDIAYFDDSPIDSSYTPHLDWVIKTRDAFPVQVGDEWFYITRPEPPEGIK